MATATVHVSAADLEFEGSYEPVGDVLYRSAVGDDRHPAAQETPWGTPSGSINKGGSPT